MLEFERMVGRMRPSDELSLPRRARTRSSTHYQRGFKVKRLNAKLQAWVDARRRHHLSHAQVQMARELGLNPAKLGKLDNHKQEPWKLPLPQFIEVLYFRRFRRYAPEIVMSIEDRARLQQQKKKARRAARQQQLGQTDSDRGSVPTEPPPSQPF